MGSSAELLFILLNADFVSFPDQGSLTNNSWSDNLHPNTSFVKFFLEKSAKKVQFFVDFLIIYM
jgi:hypothetical protein